jgi:hypothetical protein
VCQRLLPVSRVPDFEGPIAVKWAVLAATAASLAFAGVAAAADPKVDFTCNSGPLNSCAGWYRGPVEFNWVFNTGDVTPIDGECKTWIKKTFTADTAGTKVSCQVQSNTNPNQTAGNGETIHIDRTAPTITGPGLARPPDNGDWFNHPVAFGFTGQDATSKIESCTGGTYGGPDGIGVGLSGSCRDVAGNVNTGSFAINYDATPPPNPDVNVLPGARRVRLTWESSQYLTEVVRVSNASAQTLLYRGAGERFVDKRLRNGHRYRYVVTLIDQAGNRSADKTSAVPTSSPLLMPADGAHLNHPPELVWKRVKRADYYNAQLHFRNRKVLTRWPKTNRLQLHNRWRSLGSRHRLHRGLYCWYVWPGYGPRRLQKYGKVLDRSCFRITR